MTKDFFKKQTNSSRIKANIVAEYFPQYCRILLKRSQQEIRYLDLFSGPGKYDDGNFSTPLLIAHSCAKDSLLKKKVRLLFNDNEYCEQLRANFESEFGNNTFALEPRFGDKTVGEDEQILKYLTTDFTKNGKNPYPTLLFFDPWGYKGIDTLVLAKFLEGWGNEIFLFLNTKRINAAIENEKFDDLMLALFPTSIKEIRRDRKYKARVHERLSLIIDHLADEFNKAVKKGPVYSCAFRFQEEDSKTTSHFIVHFTKHLKGYELVKQVYYNYDNIGASLDKDGNYTFDAKAMDYQNRLLNFGEENIRNLSTMLIETYRGKTVSAKKLYEEHHPQTKYCASHYAKTLRWMIDKGLIKATYTDGANHRVSALIIDECIIEFNS